ncbi:MAG: FtsX-like permease family protein [Phycisphaerales bacterium]|jgi:putative ABC transport system permease protein|nr:FtsX-like permease family protein [Phycisphaerales bacterium]MBT7172028.1 FtsX-like permease family protein [Phycisphaerales bacterium]
MIHPRYIPVVVRQVMRHTTRSLLTIGGVACAMFLFCAIQGMQRGVDMATQAKADDETLIVYRKDRFCPEASKLPTHYLPRIKQIKGVKHVMPMRVMPTSCTTTLDVIVFRGVPREEFSRTDGTDLDIVAGSLADWAKREDATIIGEEMAKRRKLKIGDSFEAAGMKPKVAAIFRSADPQEQSVAYMDLFYVQKTRKGPQRGKDGQGVVTQFRVRVDDPKNLDAVAKQIDEELAHDVEPTVTRTEKEHVARAASAAMELVGFTGYLAMACLAAVLALVANAIVLSVQDRVRDIAILQTLGYRRGLISRMIMTEGLLMSVAGGFVGTLAAWIMVMQTGWSISAEGVTLPIILDGSVVLMGFGISIFVGVAASLVPALQAAKKEIATCFRAV